MLAIDLLIANSSSNFVNVVLCVKIKMFIILFITVLTIPDCYASARIYSDSQNLSPELTTVLDVTKDTITKYETPKNLLPSNQDAVKHNLYSRLNNIKRREVIVPLKLFFPKLLFDLLEEDKSWSDERTRKRNVGGANVNKKRNISRKKQKKAKVLGRLLMNNASRKNYEDIQDDYIEDEDDDYWRGVNRKKMKWEDYRNEDGASVMELIALNARHKTNLRHAENNTF